MTRFRFVCLLVLSCAFGGLANFSSAEEKAAECKILIVTGGHGFEQKEFYEMFDAFPGIVYDKAELPKDMDLLAPGLEKKYDVLVGYDMNHFPVTDAQRANFDKLLQGGMPFLVFHHCIGGYPDWPKFREIAGGAYLYKDMEIDGKTWPPSDYRHDVEMQIAVADKEHPITKGVKDFTILDETYKNVYVRDDVHLLLTCDHPLSTKQIAWTHRYEKSPIFTIMLGHDKHAYGNENLRTILKQGIAWLVNEHKKDRDE